MKYIEASKLNDNIYCLGIKEKNPIFESKEEFINYVIMPTQKEIRDYALDLYNKTRTEQELYYYGEEYILDRCKKRAKEELNNKKYRENDELLKNAEPVDNNDYVYLTEKRRVTFRDTEIFNKGFFANIDVALECIEELKKYGYSGQNFVINDSNGHAIEVYKKNNTKAAKAPKKVKEATNKTVEESKDYVDYNEEYNTFF